MASWWPAAVVALVTAGLFAPAIGFDFVYDSRTQILTDTFLHDRRNWFDVLTFRVLGRDVFDFNRPVQIASLMLDAALWGKNPLGFHLTSVAIHVANAVLVWLLVRRVIALQPSGAQSDSAPLGGLSVQVSALLAACVFAVHPVVAEAVCEPSYREDLLVAFFSLASILLAMGHDPAREGRGTLRAVACGVCCLLAIASKESAIATPLVLASYWWLFRRGDPPRFWAIVIGGAAAVTIAFLAARFLLEPSPSLIYDAKPAYLGGSLGQALLIQPRILAFYLQIVAVPVNLCADYGGASIRHLSLATALAALLGVAAAGVLAARQDRRLWFAFGLCLLPLVAVSNLVPIYRPLADRYLYYPMVGAAVVVACLLDSARFSPAGRRMAQWACLVAVVALGVACSSRERVWADDFTLWTETYSKNADSIDAMVGVANGCRLAGRLDEAERAIQQAIVATNGKLAAYWAILAIILDQMNREEPARRAWNIALEQPITSDPDRLVAELYCERELADRFRHMLAKYGSRRETPNPKGSVREPAKDAAAE